MSILGSMIKDIFRRRTPAAANIDCAHSFEAVISILQMGDTASAAANPGALGGASRFSAYDIANDPDVSNSASTKLHIGGKEAKPGWKILNIQPGACVDYVGDISDLSQFPDATFKVVYASHVLEHVAQCDMISTLSGLYRILSPGGRLMISVPDLEALCRLFVRPELDRVSRFQVMRMMFGGQIDPFDFHKIGLSHDILLAYLQAANFPFAKRVTQFGIFSDTSALALHNVPISLNLIAFKGPEQT